MSTTKKNRNIACLTPIVLLIIGLQVFAVRNTSAQSVSKGIDPSRIMIDGAAVSAHNVEGVFAAISRKYGIKIVFFSDQTKLPSTDEVVRVGRGLAYFPYATKIVPKSGSLLEVLQELLPPRFSWNIQSDILTIRPVPRMSLGIEAFLSKSVLVPEVRPCSKCTVTMGIRIEDLDNLSTSLSRLLLNGHNSDEIEQIEGQLRVLTVETFLLELLRNKRYRFVVLKQLEAGGKQVIYLNLEE